MLEYENSKLELTHNDFDNKSEVSHMTNITNLPTFLPNPITEFADPSKKVTDWRQIY